jgi:hypothetical protein
VTLPNSGGTGYLGDRAASEVVKSANNKIAAGSWVATFLPDDLPPEACEAYHMAVLGPAGGFRVYIDDKYYSSDDRSDQNEYDPKNPMYIRPGQTITFHFRSAAAPQPTVNIWLRQPQQGLY